MRQGALFVGLSLLVVGLVLAAGSPRGEKQIQQWLIGPPPKAGGAVFSFSGALDFSGERPLLTTGDGGRIELDWENPMAAKTQITDGFSASATLVCYAWSGLVDSIWSQSATYINLANCAAASLSTTPEMHDGHLMLKVTRTVTVQAPDGDPSIVAMATTWVELDDTYHSWDARVCIQAVLTEEITEHPIGSPDKANVTHAKELKCTDAWAVDDDQLISASIGDLSRELVNPDAPQDPVGVTLRFGLSAGGKHGPGGQDYCRIEGIRFNDAGINADKLDKILDPHGLPGGAWTGVPMRVYGNGSTVHLTSADWVDEANFWDNETSGAPLSYSFSGLSVADMDGKLLDNLEIWCPAVRELDGDGNDIGATKKTLAEWRAFSRSQSTGIYSWESDDPDLLAAVAFYIDLESAREHRLEGFQGEGIETSVVGFDHDGTLVICGWPLSKASRDCSPFVSDIASVDHMWYAAVYGDALAHTDWLPDAGTTAPDADGNFSVTAAGGSLTLEIPNNYEDRLRVQVPAQTAPDGVPEAYITRRSGFYAEPWPDNPEPPEGVYCWLGWAYLYLDLTAPGATTVKVLITYYDADSHSDNHLSDASRQTTYGYTTGDLTAHEYETPIGAGSQSVCIDLAVQRPMRVVKSIKLTFGAVGAWKLGWPLLALDGGDSQAQPPREAVTPHLGFKEFGHFAYKRGGISGCVDGQYLEAIAWPDDSHKNTLEPTGGHFDFVVGAESGIDLTSAWSLNAYLSLVNRCCDAWAAAYDTAAAEAAFQDDDEIWLKTPHCFDLRPTNLQGGGPFDVAVRVGRWTAVPGLHYDWCAEKIVEGQAHGWARDERRARGAWTPLHRRPADDPDAWELFEEMQADDHAHWHSSSARVVHRYEEDSAILWLYGTDTLGKGDRYIGRLACREYATGAWLGSRQAIWFHPSGQLFQLHARGAVVRLRWLPYPTIQWSEALGVDKDRGAEDLWISGLYTRPVIRMAWREGPNFVVSSTPDLGAVVDGPYSTELGWNPVRQCILSRFWYTFGHDGEHWKVRRRMLADTEFDWIPFANGEIESVICEAPAGEAVAVANRQGRLFLMLDGALYASGNGGWTWYKQSDCAELGWRWISGWHLGGWLHIVGHDGDVWRTARAYLAAGPLHWFPGADGEALHFITKVGDGQSAAEIDGRMTALAVLHQGGGEYAVHTSPNQGQTWEQRA